MKTTGKAALASLGAVALGAAAWANARQPAAEAAPIPAAKVEDAKPSVQVAPVDSDGFRPSEFSGVSVRERPSAKKSGAGKGWIGFRPGAIVRRDEAAAPSTRSAGGWSKVPAPARFGGYKVVGSGLMHSEIGVRGADGVVRHCKPGESAAEHAAHSAPSQKKAR